MPGNNNYAAKLRDPRWQKKRLEIFERDNWTCQNCGITEETLAVHHKLYLPNTEPWDYENDLLITFCETCHDAEREMLEEYEPLLISTMKRIFFADDLREIASGINSMKPLDHHHILSIAYRLAFEETDIQRFLITKARDQFKYLQKMSS